MAKFDAGRAVESLEYDFTKFGGSKGEVPEPSTKQVNKFFDDMRSFIKEARALRDQAEQSQVELEEEMSAEEVGSALDSMDETMATAAGYQAKTIEAVAELCSNTPSVSDLENLPYRVLTAFNKWLIGEITPKSETSRPPLPGGGSRQRKR